MEQVNRTVTIKQKDVCLKSQTLLELSSCQRKVHTLSIH